MTKILLFSILFAINGFTYSQNLIDEIVVEEDSKNITNLSGQFNDELSFNLIINRNKETDLYSSTVYFYNKNEMESSFLLLESKLKPRFMTYHINDDTITFSRKTTDEILIYDFNYLSKEIKIASSRIKPKLIFSHENVAFITSQYVNRFIQLAKINSSAEITEIIVKAKTNKEKSFLSNLNNENSEFIDNTKFIFKGSIKKYRGFYHNENLVFLKDDATNGIVNIYTILDNGKIDIKELKIENGVNSKKQNSYIIDNYIFILNLWKKKGIVSVYNLKDYKLVRSFEYFDDEKFGPNNKIVVNGWEVRKDFNPKKFFRTFYSAAIGTVYNSTPYIGVNKSKEGGYIIQVGHVDKNTFKNENAYNDWWKYPGFHINFNIGGGAPTTDFNIGSGIGMMSMAIFNAMADEKRKGNYFELNVDSKFNHTLGNLKSQNKYFNLSKYNERYNYKYKLKKHFFIPMNGYVRFVNFDKKNNLYKLYNINDTILLP